LGALVNVPVGQRIYVDSGHDSSDSWSLAAPSGSPAALTPVALYSLTGNMVRAGWNYFLVEGDQSKGLHNPSFVNAVLNATVRKDLSN
jgi:hypothetical protein